MNYFGHCVVNVMCNVKVVGKVTAEVRAGRLNNQGHRGHCGQ